MNCLVCRPSCEKCRPKFFTCPGCGRRISVEPMRCPFCKREVTQGDRETLLAEWKAQRELTSGGDGQAEKDPGS